MSRACRRADFLYPAFKDRSTAGEYINLYEKDAGHSESVAEAAKVICQKWMNTWSCCRRLIRFA